MLAYIKEPPDASPVHSVKFSQYQCHDGKPCHRTMSESIGKDNTAGLATYEQNDIFLIALSISGAEKPLELELGNDGRETIILSSETEMPPKPHPHNDG